MILSDYSAISGTSCGSKIAEANSAQL